MKSPTQTEYRTNVQVRCGYGPAKAPGRLTVSGAVCGIVAVVLMASGCHHLTEFSARGKRRADNQALLDETAKSNAWFHAKKTRPIWAKKLAHDQTVHTMEGPVEAHAGDFLCRGAANELWPQKASTLSERYSATGTANRNGWRKYTPRPDAEGVMAAQVHHPFTVIARWGRLSGKTGDYVVKNFRDRDRSNPDDVWLVDQSLFRATYEKVDR